jgi:hypothetical protein
MSVKVKPGVLFGPEGGPPIIAPAGYLILDALKAASRKLGQDLTITSGTDGAHSGPDDPHHKGEAYDIRSHDFPAALRPAVVKAVMDQLGWKQFYGYIENPGAGDEHFHFQRKKDTTFTTLDLLAFEPAVAA